MKVWAHRGFSHLYPENTMLAFEKAYEAGADGIETDVHLTKDGEVVVIHDESLLRTAGIDRTVGECTLSFLTSTKASRTKDDAFDANIPSFRELCDFISKRDILLNVELKTGVVYYPGIEEKVASAVREFSIEGKVVFSSFNPLSLLHIKRLLPQCKAGLLFAKGINPRHISYIARETGIDLLHPDFNIMDDEMVREAGECGLGINAWTVNEEKEMDKLMAWNVSGTITNRPDMCLRKLGR